MDSSAYFPSTVSEEEMRSRTVAVIDDVVVQISFENVTFRAILLLAAAVGRLAVRYPPSKNRLCANHMVYRNCNFNNESKS